MRVADDIVFSPKQAEPDSAELNLSEMGLTVIAADWGESGVEGTAIRTSIGQQMADRQPKVTTSVLKLAVREDADVDLATAAYRLTQKVGEMQRARRWMRRDFIVGNFAGSLLCMVTGEVTLADIGGWQVGDSPDVTLTLVRNPTWYSTDEVESGTFKEESARELIYTLPTSKSTAEGLKRVTITNLNGIADWRGLIWSEECHDYQEGPTAELEYDAVDLTLRGGAIEKTVAGVKVVQHPSLTAGWMAILSSEIDGVGHMTHLGARRVYIRTPELAEGEVFGTPVELKLIWRALGSSRWSEDNPIRAAHGEIPGLLDMGEARPQVAALGDQRWEWMLMARAPSGFGGIRIHKVYPLSTEQLLVLSEPEENAVAQEQGTQSPATVANEAVAGATAVWTNPSNVKVSDGSYATVTGEAAFSKNTQFLKATNFGVGLPEGATIVGILARIKRSFSGGGVGGPIDKAVCIVKGGEIKTKVNRAAPEQWPSSDAYRDYGGSEDLWGQSWTVADVNGSNFGVAIRAQTGFSTTTARIDHIQLIVYYTEAESEDRVCFAGRSVELRSDGVFRQAREDDVWGEVVPDGFLPYAAPSGLEGRPSRGIIIASQGDLVSLPDSGSNKFSTVVKTRDGYHFARESAGV